MKFHCFLGLQPTIEDFVVDFDLRTTIVCKKRQRMGRGPGQFSVFQIAGDVRFLRSIAHSAESLHGI